MSSVCYDTQIFIQYKPAKFPTGFVLSAVVVQELTAGAADSAEVKSWGLFRAAYEKEGRLLVPSGEDWWLAGKALNSLLRGEKSRAGGKTPKLSAGEKQRIIRDVLIAVTAKRAGAQLVTENAKDFERIRRFCNVRVVSGREWFGHGPGEG